MWFQNTFWCKTLPSFDDRQIIDKITCLWTITFSFENDSGLPHENKEQKLGFYAVHWREQFMVGENNFGVPQGFILEPPLLNIFLCGLWRLLFH